MSGEKVTTLRWSEDVGETVLASDDRTVARCNILAAADRALDDVAT